MRHTYNKKALTPASSVRGFTLVEMIVAVFIFSVVMVIAVGTLVSVVAANRKAQTVKSVMNNLNFSLESMTRSIRVGSNYNTPNLETFTYTNTNGDDISYALQDSGEGKSIARSLDGVNYSPLTAPEVNIEKLEFYLAGEGSSDGMQPRVLILIKGTAGPDDRTRTEFSLQTLVTQRFLDR